MSERVPFRRSAIGSEARGFDGDARADEMPAEMPTDPPCPFCGGGETEVMNAFGAHASVSSYWCRACRSPFEVMRWRRGG